MSQGRLLAVMAALLPLASGGAADAMAQAGAEKAEAIHAMAFGQRPSEMVLGFGTAFLADLVAKSPLSQGETGGRWDSARITAELRDRLASRAYAVDAAIFESIGGRLSHADAAELLSLKGHAAREAVLRCAMTTGSSPDEVPWEACEARHGARFANGVRVAARHYADALNASVTERPANAGLGAAVCAAASSIADSASASGTRLEFTSLRFGIGEDRARTCRELDAEAKQLWPAKGSAE